MVVFLLILNRKKAIGYYHNEFLKEMEENKELLKWDYFSNITTYFQNRFFELFEILPDNVERLPSNKSL